MLSRKSRRIAHRLTEEDWWVDFHEAFKEDSVEALQTKIDLYEIDINRTWDLRSLQHTMRIIADKRPWDHRDARSEKTLLSSAVQHGALNCVAYLKMMGARSRDRLIGSGYDVVRLDPYMLGSVYREVAIGVKEESDAIKQRICAIIKEFEEIMRTAEYNTLQLASITYGRDALITRLVRGGTRKIDKSYKLGFVALRYYADSHRASLLLAKNDGRLLLILKGLAIVNMPPELRQKIVDFAFFGKYDIERKANKISCIQQ